MIFRNHSRNHHHYQEVVWSNLIVRFFESSFESIFLAAMSSLFVSRWFFLLFHIGGNSTPPCRQPDITLPLIAAPPICRQKLLSLLNLELQIFSARMVKRLSKCPFLVPYDEWSSVDSWPHYCELPQWTTTTSWCRAFYIDNGISTFEFFVYSFHSWWIFSENWTHLTSHSNQTSTIC